jgi:MFS family permease
MAISKKARPYCVVFSAALFFLFEFINMNSFDPLNADLRQAFNVNALQISNLSAMYFYANVLFLVPAGLLLDRLSTKRLLQIAIMICILGDLVFASTHSFMVAKICRFIVGFGSTFCLLSTTLLTARWIPAQRAGLTMGLVVTLAMLGGSIAQQLPYLVNWLGSWRYAMVAIAGLGIFFLGIISLLVQDYPEDCSENHARDMKLIAAGFFPNLILVLRNKQVVFSGLYTSFINLTVMIIGALWGVEYLQVVHGIPLTKASFVVTLIFFGLIVGCPLFGWISDQMRRRKLPMILGGILNIICVLVILMANLSYLELVIAFFLLGVFSSSQILTYPLIMESTPSHIIASSEAFSAVLIMGGGALFQPLFGFILDHFSQGTGTYTPQAFQHAMLILPITFLIATLLACFLKETHCKR